MKDKNRTPLQVLREEGVQFRIGGPQDYEYEKAWGETDANFWMKRYTQEGFLVEPMPTLKYTLAENEKLQTIKPKLNTFVKDMCQRWILGVEDFDTTYDNFLKELKHIGLDEALEINQKAYERFISSN